MSLPVTVFENAVQAPVRLQLAQILKSYHIPARGGSVVRLETS